MSKHTSELWHHSDCIIYAEDQLGTDEYVAKAETIADARRIVACVNACKGISTETLERVDLPLNAIVLMSQQARLIREHDEALAKISESAAENDRLRAKLAAMENRSMAWLANALEQYTSGDVITVPDGAGTEEDFFAWLKAQPDRPAVAVLANTGEEEK